MTYKKIIAIFIILILIPIALEIGLRQLGISPIKIRKYKIESSPSSCILADEKLGFKLNDGKFNVVINSGLKYKATHFNGCRITSFDSLEIVNPKSDIGIMGGSFTYGLGIDDSLTFPFLMAEHFKDVSVKNYGVIAYGIIQQIFILEKLIAEQNTPTTLIYCYLNFHQARAALNRSYQYDLWQSRNFSDGPKTGYSSTEHWAIPYGVIKKDSLEIKSMPISDIKPISRLRRKSALYSILLYSFFDRKPNTLDISQKAIERLNNLCLENNIQFVVAFMTEMKADKLYKYCERSNISTVDISVDLNQEGYRNNPYDNHPSAIANAEYAKFLIDFLEPKY